MRLCAILTVKGARRVRGIEPPTFQLLGAELEMADLHPDEDTSSHGKLELGMVRVCVPVGLIQEQTLPFAASS